ncbi:MAG: hypothetical protein HIU84_09930 [Acidobacteria bacterium]|nr:hypothetical protein [Acidobacteriota bacterium]
MTTKHDPSGGVQEVSARNPDGTTGRRAAPPTNAEPAPPSVEEVKPTWVNLEMPPDVEPPTMGRPMRKLKSNVRRNVADPKRPGYVLVPPPNAKELALWQERDYVATIASSIRTQREVANTVGTGMVLFISPKGNGAKTTQTIWNASGFCIETGTEVTVFDANFAAGTAAQRLHFNRGGTLTERELIDHYPELSVNHQTLNAYLKNNRDRVRVLAASPIIQGGRKLIGPEYAKAAQLLRDNCDFLYVDTPNDITSEQCLALIKMANVLVFVANVGEQDSLRKLWEGMETLRSYGFVDKVNNSVVSVSNMPPGAEAAHYRMYLNEVDVHNRVVRDIPGHVGPLVGIRHDRAMADARPVDFGALQRETAQDIRLVNTAIWSRLPKKAALQSLSGSVHPWLNGNSPAESTHLVPVNQS